MHKNKSNPIIKHLIASLTAIMVALLLASCGGDDEAAASDTEAAAAPAADSSDQPEGDQPEEPAADSSANAEAPSTDGSGGGGTVTIDGVAYSFVADLCFSESSFIQVSGPGQTADGNVFWVDISVSTDTDYDEDGTPDPTGTVAVEVGVDSAIGSQPDGMEDFEATYAPFLGAEDFNYTLDGNSISGSGQIADWSGIAIPFGEYAPLEFTATCG